MTNRGDTNQLNWPRWAQALLIVVLAVLAGVRLFSLADNVANRAGFIGDITTLGADVGIYPGADPGFLKVATIDSGGPMAKAGVRPGDLVRFKPLHAPLVRQVNGTRIDFELEQGGVRMSRQLTVEPARLSEAERRSNFRLAFNMLAAIVTLLIGCFLLWRGWGNRTAMLLGAALIPLGVATPSIPPVLGGPFGSRLTFLLYYAAIQLVFLLPYFAMRIYREGLGNPPNWMRRTVTVFTAVALLHGAANTWANLTLTVLPVWYTGNDIGYLIAQIALVASVGILVAAWRNSVGAARNRNAVILFAFSAYFLGAIVGFTLLGGGVIVLDATVGPLAFVNALMAGVIAPGLLAYAVLRQKLFDLGFVINRTLVFGAISTILLVSFGTLEWAVDHLVPKSWHEASAFYSAGIAVGLFLLFHRIRDRVEHLIERLFFRSWQQNEAALKRFVAAAAHVEKPEALAGNFVAELVRFTGGAAASFYARTAEGHYANAAGETIDADDPALAAMRAEQGAVVPAELGSPMQAALALPMMHQAALAGFVLLGPKPSGEDYRPDEVEIMAWATQQVGLDLQAIRVRDLEKNVVKLEARNANLSAILATAALTEA